MDYEALKKRIIDDIGNHKYTTDRQTDSDIELSKHVTDADIDLMEREAKAFNLIRKPRYYVVTYIFLRYRIPIMYHRVINFITGR